MAETQVGTKAVVWGLTTGATATGMGTFETESADFSVESDVATIPNSLGQTITEVYFNQRQTLRMTVRPTGTTKALAKAANVLPAPGEIVTVTDTDDTEVAGTNSGKFIFVRGDKNKSNTKETMLTFELKQYVENNVAVLLS